MAEGKNSFILYADLLPTVEKLSDKRAGVLFKTILRYVNDKNPEVTDILVDLVFESVKQQLKRDLKEWEGTRSERSASGKMGNLKRWHKDLYKQVVDGQLSLEESQKIANDRYATKAIAKIAVTDTVNVNVKQQEAFLKNNIRKEAFCMAKSISISDLDKIQQQFLFDVSGKEIKDLWKYFETVYDSGAYNSLKKKMVL